MKYYIMKAFDTTGSDFIFLENDSIDDNLKSACCNSQFQYVDKNLKLLKLSEESGNELPDFIYDELNEVPLISCRLKRLFDELDIRSLFYQRLRLESKANHISESYWLAIPMKIDCLDYDASDIDEIINEDGKILKEASKIVINPENVGNYEIFKLANVVNSQIIVTENLKNAVEQAGLTAGFGFFDI